MLKNTNEGKIILPCACSDHAVEVIRWKEDGDDINMWWITLMTSMFSVSQNNIFEIFKRRILLAWSMLRGKEYELFDIGLTDESAEKLVKFIQENK